MHKGYFNRLGRTFVYIILLLNFLSDIVLCFPFGFATIMVPWLTRAWNSQGVIELDSLKDAVKHSTLNFCGKAIYIATLRGTMMGSGTKFSDKIPDTSKT